MDSSPIGKMLIEARPVGEAEVRERFEHAQEEGDLPPDADPKQLAEYIRTVIYGMTLKAASGRDARGAGAGDRDGDARVARVRAGH